MKHEGREPDRLHARVHTILALHDDEYNYHNSLQAQKNDHCFVIPRVHLSSIRYLDLFVQLYLKLS